MQGKLAFWGPKMGTNGPKKPLLPESIKQNELMVDGYKIEIKGTTGVLAHRPYVWIPSQKALVGNIAVFGDLHVWTADNQTQDKLDAWLTQLTQMQNLAPKMVVPGHMQKGTNLDANNINYTISYLNTFIQEKKNSKNAEELINKMKLAYPSSQLPLALSIGAKVHMGEMKW
jgi:glyoxylase-like metal-dependent hydrolase (beta-lactamase superfamily II)